MSRVLITAGASGIGLAMGHAFAETGAQIWVTDVDQTALDAVPKTWRASKVDASDEAAMGKASTCFAPMLALPGQPR